MGDDPSRNDVIRSADNEDDPGPSTSLAIRTRRCSLVRHEMYGRLHLYSFGVTLTVLSHGVPFIPKWVTFRLGRLNEAAGAADAARAMLLTLCRNVVLLTAIFAFL
jgi:hypothetical protein